MTSLEREYECRQFANEFCVQEIFVRANTFVPAFNALKKRLSDATCGFWNVSTSSWSSDGCTLVSFDDFSSQCECDHLTNFAVLLDINGNLGGAENVSLVSRVRYSFPRKSIRTDSDLAIRTN